MQYRFKDIEEKWQAIWQDLGSYTTKEDPSKEKFYILDMFPYPSGAGLHVGHPLGYICSDIIARYKRHCGFNVLHPMGYDAFGLPAEQYAIQTGQHPAVTIEENSQRYRKQLDRIGLSFDWSREFKTCDPSYYKWTQWVFKRLFSHWYCVRSQRAKPIAELEAMFAANGNADVAASHSCRRMFSAGEWTQMSAVERSDILHGYRLAYQAETMVNWCPALGTVLANDEIKDGLSERGGHPVEQKKMVQWSLRITAYAERLLTGLEQVDWPSSIKDIQRNWIGKSLGAEVDFPVEGRDHVIRVFTTRPDTLFGVTFMVLAPEADLVAALTTDDRRQEVESYVRDALKRSERDRLADTKSVTGAFTGSYCKHPLTGERVPIYIADYVLAGYGTGAIMAVPAHDARDHAFAKKMNLPIKAVYDLGDVQEQAYDAKTGVCINSDFINGLAAEQAIDKMCRELEQRKIGQAKVNYKLRDAIFSRQRYWGEPFPVAFRDGIAETLADEELPLTLPPVDKFLPTDAGDPPLGRAETWSSREGLPLELSTMPGFAGSSAYYLRYCDPHNDEALISKEKNQYWRNVDLYVGGSEHATGHLLYSRFWNKFLFDLGLIQDDEPFKKLFNQGMIQGRSNFVYRVKGTNRFVSHGLKEQFETQQLHVDVNLVRNDELDVEAFKSWRADYKDAEFILEDGKYVCGFGVEKMSKSMFNVINPDDVIDQYGADTLRLYEMFLGPIEQAKPWNTNGIDGVSRFLFKFWRLFYSEKDEFLVDDSTPSADELKILHTMIKKIRQDMDELSLNTSVSAFMIAVNELGKLKCYKRAILEPMLICLSPFAPHVAEQLWQALGHQESILDEPFPICDDSVLVESRFQYPVSFNGKMRFLLEMPLDSTQTQIEQAVLAHDSSQKYLAGKTVRKVIVVPKKIVNIVVS